MKILVTIATIIVALIALGFILGLGEGPVACTEMACGCPIGVEEQPCNSCGQHDPVFRLWVFNINKVCRGKEILLCDGDSPTPVQYGHRFEWDTCNYEVSFFTKY